MATGPCEALERTEEPTQETPKRDPRKQLGEESKEDAKMPPSQEETLSTPNGIGRGEAEKLHVVEKDLEEFVDSVTEVAQPARVPPTPAQPPPKPPAKSPRAEQVAEKVLRAEKVTERPPPRVEKMRPAGLTTPKTVPAKRKTAAKETLPWEGLTLNKCLLVASFVALLSVSCQVVQDIIDYSENVLKAELEAWSQQESDVGELDERWFYETWLDWSDTEEPPDIEEAEEEEEEEEMVETEEEVVAENGEEEEEDEEEEPAVKERPKKSRREKPAKEKKVKGPKAGPKEEEVRRGKRKGKEEEEEEDERKPRKRIRRPKEGDVVGKGGRKTEKDSKERKPRATERAFFPSHKAEKRRA